MFATPTVAEVIELARRLGVELEPEEAASYRDSLVGELGRFDEFVTERLPEFSPPLFSPARARGHRPSAGEDPYNAWLWKCRIEGATEGLLAGRTVSFKDHVSVAGIPQSGGIYALEGLVPDFDATVVDRVLRAGGTVIGKNTMNPSGGGKGNEPGTGDYWRPKNPHDPAHYTGGSSAGSAAAVAAREVDISFGGDQGGSVRLPAAYCGVIGLKPTFGLVSHMGIAYGSEPSIDHVGPLARTTEDCARALEAVAGADGLDPRQARDVPEHFEALSRLDGGVKGLRIGLLAEGFADPVEPEIAAGVRSAVAILEKQGATVVEVSVPEHQTINTAYVALMTEGARAIFDTGPFGFGARTFYPRSVTVAMNRLFRHDLAQLRPRVLRNYLLAELSRQNYDGAVYAKAQNVRPHFTACYDRALEQVDLLAMPTCRDLARRAEDGGDPPGGPATLGRDGGSVPERSYNTNPFDYTGHPALALPCGKVGRLPYSLQLVGGRLEDDLLLRAAYTYEHSVDWEAQISTGS